LAKQYFDADKWKQAVVAIISIGEKSEMAWGAHHS
jgi:hypothetical protein